jgi:endoglucanase
MDGSDGMGRGRGFLSARGPKVVDETGNAVRLRGVGIGGWLLPEGYMWRLPAPADRPRTIEALVRTLVGADAAKEFWHTYYDRFVCEADIARLAEDGFNSVRVAINARTILAPQTSGAAEPLFDPRAIGRIDRLIGWCRSHGLYVVLDLHGAPGGQTGTNIDDCEHDRPELFTNERNAELTVRIWRALAERYRDEWAVAGYDLLNEPLPNWFSEYNNRLLPLYRRITEAIREVDRKHMIILEGAHWATDWSVFTEKIDDNLLLQFHKYWNSPDRESLAPYLSKRDEWQVPIYMGEGGENSLDWYAGAFRLYEDLDIGWNFWAWKKLNTDNSVVSIRQPERWHMITDAASGGPVPPPGTAREILSEFLDNLTPERCEYRDAVVNALFRRPEVRIPAVFYAYHEEGAGFDGAHQPPGTEAAGAYPRATFRVEDRMPVVTTGDPAALRFDHGAGEPRTIGEWLMLRMDAGSWAVYDFDASRLGQTPGGEPGCAVTVAWVGPADARMELRMDEPAQTTELALHGDAGTATASFRVTPGPRRVTIRALAGSALIRSVTIAGISMPAAG